MSDWITTARLVLAAAAVLVAMLGIRLLYLWCTRDRRYERASRHYATWLALRERARRIALTEITSVLKFPAAWAVPPDTGQAAGFHVPEAPSQGNARKGVVATGPGTNGRSAPGVGRCASASPGGEALSERTSPMQVTS